MCPTASRNSIPACHSGMVSSTSRVKSWRCLKRAVKISRLRGVTLGPIALMTFWVKLGSNLGSPLESISTDLDVFRVLRWCIGVGFVWVRGMTN
jgi:hypothetical protein